MMKLEKTQGKYPVTFYLTCARVNSDPDPAHLKSNVVNPNPNLARPGAF
jgi:hypothetical protein